MLGLLLIMCNCFNINSKSRTNTKQNEKLVGIDTILWQLANIKVNKFDILQLQLTRTAVISWELKIVGHCARRAKLRRHVTPWSTNFWLRLKIGINIIKIQSRNPGIRLKKSRDLGIKKLTGIPGFRDPGIKTLSVALTLVSSYRP